MSLHEQLIVHNNFVRVRLSQANNSSENKIKYPDQQPVKGDALLQPQI